MLKQCNKQFCKQDFLIVDLKVDSNLWTPVYVCESLKAQAEKNMQDLFIYFIYLYVIITLSVKITAWASKDYVLDCLFK